jgi:hypothetical protein
MSEIFYSTFEKTNIKGILWEKENVALVDESEVNKM